MAGGQGWVRVFGAKPIMMARRGKAMWQFRMG